MSPLEFAFLSKKTNRLGNSLVPACRVVEVVVSRKTGHKFPRSLKAAEGYWMNTSHTQIFKTFWVMVSRVVNKFFPYDTGCIRTTVLTRSLNQLLTVWARQHNRTSLAHPSKEPLDYGRNWWKTCEGITFGTDREHMGKQRNQASVHIPFQKLGLDSTLGFWHIWSRV